MWSHRLVYGNYIYGIGIIESKRFYSERCHFHLDVSHLWKCNVHCTNQPSAQKKARLVPRDYLHEYDFFCGIPDRQITYQVQSMPLELQSE